MGHMLHDLARQEICRGEAAGVRIFGADDLKVVNGKKVVHEGAHVAINMNDDGSLSFTAMFDSTPRGAFTVKQPASQSKLLSRLVAQYKFHAAKHQAIRIVVETQFSFNEESGRY